SAALDDSETPPPTRRGDHQISWLRRQCGVVQITQRRRSWPGLPPPAAGFELAVAKFRPSPATARLTNLPSMAAHKPCAGVEIHNCENEGYDAACRNIAALWPTITADDCEGVMGIKTFYEVGSGRPVSLSASAVAGVYPDPDNEELVTIELVNGSKYTVKADINSVRKWVEAG